MGQHAAEPSLRMKTCAKRMHRICPVLQCIGHGRQSCPRSFMLCDFSAKRHFTSTKWVWIGCYSRILLLDAPVIPATFA